MNQTFQMFTLKFRLKLSKLSQLCTKRKIHWNFNKMSLLPHKYSWPKMMFFHRNWASLQTNILYKFQNGMFCAHRKKHFYLAIGTSMKFYRARIILILCNKQQQFKNGAVHECNLERNQLHKLFLLLVSKKEIFDGKKLVLEL